MLRTPLASASKLAFFGLVVLGSAACAEGLGATVYDYVGAGGGDTGSHGASTSSSGTGGAGGAGAAGGASPVSTSSGVIEGAGGSFSSSSGGGTCDSSGDCDTCGNCALAGTCQPEMDACNADQNCVALLGCLDGCTDQTCADDCATQYGEGTTEYEAMVTCVLCDACPVSCSAESQGGCGP